MGRNKRNPLTDNVGSGACHNDESKKYVSLVIWSGLCGYGHWASFYGKSIRRWEVLDTVGGDESEQTRRLKDIKQNGYFVFESEEVERGAVWHMCWNKDSGFSRAVSIGIQQVFTLIMPVSPEMQVDEYTKFLNSLVEESKEGLDENYEPVTPLLSHPWSIPLEEKKRRRLPLLAGWERGSRFD